MLRSMLFIYCCVGIGIGEDTLDQNEMDSDLQSAAKTADLFTLGSLFSVTEMRIFVFRLPPLLSSPTWP